MNVYHDYDLRFTRNGTRQIMDKNKLELVMTWHLGVASFSIIII